MELATCAKRTSGHGCANLARLAATGPGDSSGRAVAPTNKFLSWVHKTAGSVLPRSKHGKAEMMSIKPIEGRNDFFELAREMKYASKQIDKLHRELEQLRKDYDESLRAPEGWLQAGAAFATPRRETH